MVCVWGGGGGLGGGEGGHCLLPHSPSVPLPQPCSKNIQVPIFEECNEDNHYSNSIYLLYRLSVGCRIGGAKIKETRYSTVTVGFDRILQPTLLHFANMLLYLQI